jgi:hypothetical protein
VEWLQRDLGLYVVGLFDTHLAMKQLTFNQFSLQALIAHYLGTTLEKKFQLADWRLRYDLSSSSAPNTQPLTLPLSLPGRFRMRCSSTPARTRTLFSTSTTGSGTTFSTQRPTNPPSASSSTNHSNSHYA